MLPALQQLQSLWHLGGFGLCKAEGQPGIWWWSLGDWEFFSAPPDPTCSAAQKVAFSLASKPPAAFSPRLSGAEALLGVERGKFQVFCEHRGHGWAFWFLRSSRWRCWGSFPALKRPASWLHACPPVGTRLEPWAVACLASRAAGDI